MAVESVVDIFRPFVGATWKRVSKQSAQENDAAAARVRSHHLRTALDFLDGV